MPRSSSTSTSCIDPSMSLYDGLHGRGMDSQVTLVDESVFGTPHAIVSFVRDDMKNTRILSANEQILYSVSTDKTTNTHTVIRRGDTDEVIAEVKRKDLRPDTIQFGKEEKKKLSSWLNGMNGRWSDL